MVTIYAGTSGFAYREWRGKFYPRDLAAAKMLAFYATRLPAVEINASFYRMPASSMLERWGTQVPDRFRFALKASGQITHRKKLVDVEQDCQTFVGRARALGSHLGPLLFQLPPLLPRDLQLLRHFITLLEGIRAAFEFRHASWFGDDTYTLLREFGCALCISDREGAGTPPVVSTAPFGYLRLRREWYSHADLKRWRAVIDEQGWEEVFVFFRHEETGEGARQALLLLDAPESKITGG